MCSVAGRGIPDVAAQAIRLASFKNGEEYAVNGTSGATPARYPSPLCWSIQLTNSPQIVAGIISLLNDYLLSKGRKPLGFLNPLLYGIARAGINDIISGSNPGCGTEGFSAVVGWDPVRHRNFHLFIVDP